MRCGTSALTYAELDREAGGVAAGLLARGIAPGERVALFMRNDTAYVSALFGCFRAGLVAVPVNARLHPRELAFVLEHAACSALFFDDDHAAEVAAATAEVRPRLLVGTGSAGGADVGFGDVAGGATVRDAEVAPDDPAWLFYTSGTTGFPKGATLSHRNLLTMLTNALAEMHAFEPDDVALHAAPLSHGSGMYLLPAIARGALNLVYDGQRFDPADVLATAARERVTVFAFLAPTMLVLLLDAAPAIRLPSLRKLMYGGAPLHARHARAAVARFGPVLCQLYGQGEAPMTIAHLPPALHDLAPDAELVPAGLPFASVEVRIVDEEDNEVPAGEIGEVVVRGDVVMTGYWHNAEATARALRGGWLHTGDVGRAEPSNGLLYLLDRKHDMIISGGSNVYPREVEEALLRHPAVHEACVFGSPDELWGEIVVAAVVVQAGETVAAEELIEHCRSLLASFKKPKSIMFLDAIPTNASGKMLRRVLRDQFIAAPV